MIANDNEWRYMPRYDRRYQPRYDPAKPRDTFALLLCVLAFAMVAATVATI